jgi:hypothetical protein
VGAASPAWAHEDPGHERDAWRDGDERGGPWRVTAAVAGESDSGVIVAASDGGSDRPARLQRRPAAAATGLPASTPAPGGTEGPDARPAIVSLLSPLLPADQAGSHCVVSLLSPSPSPAHSLPCRLLGGSPAAAPGGSASVAGGAAEPASGGPTGPGSRSSAGQLLAAAGRPDGSPPADETRRHPPESPASSVVRSASWEDAMSPGALLAPLAGLSWSPDGRPDAAAQSGAAGPSGCAAGGDGSEQPGRKRNR